jgi:hypothetical protein
MGSISDIVRLLLNVRASHLQYDNDTILPPPLHEMALLKRVAFGAGTDEQDDDDWVSWQGNMRKAESAFH